MENEKFIYVVQVVGGCYDELYHYIIGVWPTFDQAMEQAKEECLKRLVDEKTLPMTFDEFLDCGCGYPDDPWENDPSHEYTDEENNYINSLIDRDGHTVKEFEIMSEAWEKEMDDFCSCRIDQCVLGKSVEELNGKIKLSTTYISNDSNNKGEFIINKY